MKVEIKVTEVTHEELVYFFSTALYGSDLFVAVYDRHEWGLIPSDKTEGDCYEDSLADMILNDKSIKILDLEEDEYHTVKLKDILKALSTEKGLKLFKDVVSGEGDYFDASNLLQLVIFGEIIYG